MIRNTITYTVQSLYPKMLVQREATVTRKDKLTHVGAKRVLRSLEIPVVDVERVESAIVEA